MTAEGKWSNKGYCHCCRKQTLFIAYEEWLRDHYICSTCGSIPRQRHLQFVLDSFFPEWETLTIHESSPSNDYVSRWAQNYSYSHFWPDISPGDLREGIRCESIEALTFPDGTFDIFITQDVMEHVFHPERAVKEIMRVMKEGGVYVFTAPKKREVSNSYLRATQGDDGSVRHIHEPDYHGNPVGDGKALVTWDYGRDFEYLLTRWSGNPVTTYITKDRFLGLDAELIDVFVIQKEKLQERHEKGSSRFAAFWYRLDSLVQRHIIYRRTRRMYNM